MFSAYRYLLPPPLTNYRAREGAAMTPFKRPQMPGCRIPQVKATCDRTRERRGRRRRAPRADGADPLSHSTHKPAVSHCRTRCACARLPRIRDTSRLTYDRRAHSTTRCAFKRLVLGPRTYPRLMLSRDRCLPTTAPLASALWRLVSDL